MFITIDVTHWTCSQRHSPSGSHGPDESIGEPRPGVSSGPGDPRPGTAHVGQ